MNTSSGFEPAALRTAPRSRYRILAIDNEPSIARLLARLLGRDHDLQSCVSADDACDLIRRGATFDVILCDVLMPGKSGPDFYRYVSRFAPDLCDRIVFITGAICLPSTHDFLDVLSNVTLQKPFTRTALTAAVSDVGARSVKAAAEARKARCS
jgi:DNA-binding NtrC family response regulator